MRRPIHFWHGYDEALSAKLTRIPGVIAEPCPETTWDRRPVHLFYEGSLDALDAAYDGPLLVTKTSIAVTQFRNFGQR